MDGDRKLELTTSNELSSSALLDQWVGQEALERKLLGLSEEEIAKSIRKIARREESPLVTAPDEVELPTDYYISERTVIAAYSRVLEDASPPLPPNLMVQILIRRLEKMFSSLLPKVLKGDPKGIAEARRVLAQIAKMLGCGEPPRIELAAGLDGDTDEANEREARMEAARALTPEELQLFTDLLQRGHRRVEKRNNEKLVGHRMSAEANSCIHRSAGDDEDILLTNDDESALPFLPLPLTPSSRQLVLEFLQEHHEAFWHTEEVAKRLWTDPEQTLAVLESLQKQKLVTHQMRLGLGCWRYGDRLERDKAQPSIDGRGNPDVSAIYQGREIQRSVHKTPVSSVAENSEGLKNTIVGSSELGGEEQPGANSGRAAQGPNGGKPTISVSREPKTGATAAATPIVSPRGFADWELLAHQALKFLSSNGSKAYSVWKIAQAVGWDQDSVGRMLDEFVKNGGVVKLSNGQWKYNSPFKVAS